ncbi:MAG: CoA transferase [Nocardioides sp.]|nr:CoA transferase [Nocardioides sp.]
MQPRPREPLANITVLNLSRALAGPRATMMLGDLGAQPARPDAADLARRR